MGDHERQILLKFIDEPFDSSYPRISDSNWGYRILNDLNYLKLLSSNDVEFVRKYHKSQNNRGITKRQQLKLWMMIRTYISFICK